MNSGINPGKPGTCPECGAPASVEQVGGIDPMLGDTRTHKYRYLAQEQGEAVAWRPITTEAEYVAAINAGEWVEFSIISRDTYDMPASNKPDSGGWILCTSTDDWCAQGKHRAATHPAPVAHSPAGVDEDYFPNGDLAGSALYAIHATPNHKLWEQLSIGGRQSWQEKACAALTDALQPAAGSEANWLPIATIPKDGTRVQLLSANGKTDFGNWYAFAKPLLPSPDIQDHLNTDNGEGNYTHWKPAAGSEGSP